MRRAYGNKYQVSLHSILQRGFPLIAYNHIEYRLKHHVRESSVSEAVETATST